MYDVDTQLYIQFHIFQFITPRRENIQILVLPDQANQLQWSDVSLPPGSSHAQSPSGSAAKRPQVPDLADQPDGLPAALLHPAAAQTSDVCGSQESSFETNVTIATVKISHSLSTLGLIQ